MPPRQTARIACAWRDPASHQSFGFGGIGSPFVVRAQCLLHRLSLERRHVVSKRQEGLQHREHFEILHRADAVTSRQGHSAVASTMTRRHTVVGARKPAADFHDFLENRFDVHPCASPRYRALRAELLQVVIEVLVHQLTPLFSGHLPEKRVRFFSRG